jgi:O-antigen/teichoic acid export membrane protein
MIATIRNNIKTSFLAPLFEFLEKGSSRTVLLKKNILGSFGLKGISFLISYARVPIVLDYISVTEYGIWITLSSIIGWFTLFDIGLGNGLRNKLAESMAINDLKSAKTYISTTYAAIAIIMGCLSLILFAVSPWINWTIILNAPDELSHSLFLVILITFATFVFQFILNLIVTVLTADQRPTVGSAIGMIGGILSLIVIIVLKKTTTGSLVHLSIASGGPMLLVLFLSSIYFYRDKYRSIRPSISAVNFKHFDSLAVLGIQFFIVQISVIIIFTTDNIIITQLLGPEAVTPYNLALKYMEIVPMVLSMIMWPLWSAYTEAYAKKDYVWIKKTVNMLIKMWCVSVVLIMLQLVPARWFFHLWIGDKLLIPALLLFLMGLYYILTTWCQIFGFFINGVGKIRLQLYSGIVQGLLNIPISIFFAKYMGMGSAGVILGTCVCLSIGAIWAPIQYHKIINGTAQGIWAK